MSYPDDDSCPICGEANGTGFKCAVCPSTCIACDWFGDHSNGCKQCSIIEFVDMLDQEGHQLLMSCLEQNHSEEVNKVFEEWMKTK